MENFIRCQRLRLGAGQRLFENLRDLIVGQPADDAERDCLPNPLPRDLGHARAANQRGPRCHLHAARRVLLEDAVRFQIGVGPCHDLRIGQQLLCKRAILRQHRSSPQRPGSDVDHHLAGDLLVNRHRRIVLDIEHGNVDLTH